MNANFQQSVHDQNYDSNSTVKYNLVESHQTKVYPESPKTSRPIVDKTDQVSSIKKILFEIERHRGRSIEEEESG
jgi:predicted component of type VI protein secretion system